MKIYISGISGTGMGPLALMAKQAGFEVVGTDLQKGAIYDELIKAGIKVEIGPQDGVFLKKEMGKLVEPNRKASTERQKRTFWFVYTSALPDDHPELKLAREVGVKVSKRDALTAYLVEKLGLKMVAVAGTHGKTTTTAMIVYGCLKMGLPVSYIVGTTLGFAPSGAYHLGDRFFIYEADEYDRNFLKFHPWLSVITTVSYDHPDIYQTKKEYEEAFAQFRMQSESVIDENTRTYTDYELAGAVRRYDAGLATMAVNYISIENLAMEIDAEGGDMLTRFKKSMTKKEENVDKVVEMSNQMNNFPGVGRRFERIADGVYTDYAHHPEEIAATVEIAREEAELRKRKGVVVVYQPHQNVRQHEVREGYKDAFCGAEKIFWLPTYLTRDDPTLEIIQPKEFIADLINSQDAEPAELGDELKDKLKKYIADGYLVILMTAGPADGWLRENFGE